MVNGYQVSQALHVAATLGIADHLASGSLTAAELAEASNAHPGALSRLLHALATIGVLIEHDGRYALTELGNALRSDTPGSVAGWARLVGRPYYWQAWSGLLHSIRTGDNAFAATHGTSVWQYRSVRPAELAISDAAMTALSGAVTRAVAEAYDFSRFTTVVDVGGGHGGLLAAVLRRHPTVRGVLFDRPEVVAGAGEVLDPAGVAERVTRVAGDFFSALPEGGDAYVLTALIHDWPDTESVAILRACRQVVPDSGVVLLVERLLDQGPDPARTAFSDLNMLVAPGGQERTLDEYRALLARAGLTLRSAVPTGTDVFVLEASPGPIPERLP